MVKILDTQFMMHHGTKAIQQQFGVVEQCPAQLRNRMHNFALSSAILNHGPRLFSITFKRCPISIFPFFSECLRLSSCYLRNIKSMSGSGF